MRTPTKSPTTYVCQYIESLPNGEKKICGREFSARKPTEFCPICRKRIKNRRDQEKWRTKHKQELEFDTPKINNWRVFVHRLRQGHKLTPDHLFTLFHVHAHFGLLSPDLKSSIHRIEPEVCTPAAVDFHVFTPEGRRAFTYTLFGPNSMGYGAGIRYALDMGEDEVVNAKLKAAVISHASKGHPLCLEPETHGSSYRLCTHSDQPSVVWHRCPWSWVDSPSYRVCWHSNCHVPEKGRLSFLTYWVSHVTMTLWVSERDEQAKQQEAFWRNVNKRCWKEPGLSLLDWLKYVPRELREAFCREAEKGHDGGVDHDLFDCINDLLSALQKNEYWYWKVFGSYFSLALARAHIGLVFAARLYRDKSYRDAYVDRHTQWAGQVLAKALPIDERGFVRWP